MNKFCKNMLFVRVVVAYWYYYCIT